MKTKLLFTLIVASLVFTGCNKDNDDTKPVEKDIYLEFKADATPRWETGKTVEKNEESGHIFVIDNGQLFASTKYKIGRVAASDNFEFVEFAGTPAAGIPSEALIRTQSGTAVPHKIEILKVADGKVWIAYKATASSEEKRIVQ